MINKAVARRYAQALFSVAREKDLLEDLGNELRLIIDTIHANEKLLKIFQHQRISSTDKKELFIELFKERVSQTALNFLQLLFDKQRERFLEQIYEEYMAMANEARNIFEAEVRSAVELSAEDVKVLEDKLSRMTGKRVKVKTQVDPNLIGGVVVKLGDRILDGSVANRLKMLEEKLKEADFKEIGVRE
ncbi:F0F1 ATP synthase subunit delta [Calderihabitans maritimus]|uniref:ATP synthase subunit delta n=1 Tax=Calderihabitans maritimus TaxID=1246530 RepID=A0A1Z5HWE4_9FIRM|nr:F0F1 ATP synthase subunit delta [Calderihabitans maritimus]GAW93834.1 ATP synthase F1 subunit delta [Calderihabitans maritimus]